MLKKRPNFSYKDFIAHFTASEAFKVIPSTGTTPFPSYKDFIAHFTASEAFKVIPSTGTTPFPTFLPLLKCFLEFCDGVQFSYRIFMTLPSGLETTSFQSGFKCGTQEKVFITIFITIYTGKQFLTVFNTVFFLIAVNKCGTNFALTQCI
jgi:hypothetical protein